MCCWGSVTFWDITDKTNNEKGRITVRGLSAGGADGHFFAKKQSRRLQAGSVILPLPRHDVELYTSGRF